MRTSQGVERGNRKTVAAKKFFLRLNTQMFENCFHFFFLFRTLKTVPRTSRLGLKKYFFLRWKYYLMCCSIRFWLNMQRCEQKGNSCRSVVKIKGSVFAGFLAAAPRLLFRSIYFLRVSASMKRIVKEKLTNMKKLKIIKKIKN